MNALLAALNTKLTDSALFNDASGRVYLDQADSPDYPRVVYSIVSAVPDRTFDAKYQEILIQFSLFSAKSAGMSIMTTMYNDLIALLDEQNLDISGDTFVAMQEENLVTTMETLTTPLPDGSNGVVVWHVDFSVTIKKS